LLLADCSKEPIKLNERYYQKKWCLDRGGKIEFRLEEDSVKYRCDCLLPDYAVEFDWAGKWEAMEQALHYGRLSGRQPGIVFICRKPGDKRKIDRTERNIKYYNQPVRVWRENCGD
jgi:hypothetical protein